jgi:hypothetical protein
MQSEGKTIIHSLQRRGKFEEREKKKKKKSPPIPKEEKVGTNKTKQSSGIFFKGERSSF